MPTTDSAQAQDLDASFDFEVPPMDGMQDLVRMKFLYQAVLSFAHPQIGRVLEIGCFKGCSTVFLAMACRQLGFDGVTTIDVFTGTPSWGVTIDTFDEARRRFIDYGLSSFVNPIRANSATFEWQQPLAVLHIDGDHAYEAFSTDLARFTPWLAPGGIVVIDDYDSGHDGVLRATHEFLIKHSDFSIAGVSNSRQYYGSICLRRNPLGW